MVNTKKNVEITSQEYFDIEDTLMLAKVSLETAAAGYREKGWNKYAEHLENIIVRVARARKTLDKANDNRLFN